MANALGPPLHGYPLPGKLKVFMEQQNLFSHPFTKIVVSLTFFLPDGGATMMETPKGLSLG